MQSSFQDNLPKIYALLAKREINMHRCGGGAFYDKNKRKKIMVIA